MSALRVLPVRLMLIATPRATASVMMGSKNTTEFVPNALQAHCGAQVPLAAFTSADRTLLSQPPKECASATLDSDSLTNLAISVHLTISSRMATVLPAPLTPTTPQPTSAASVWKAFSSIRWATALPSAAPMKFMINPHISADVSVDLDASMALAKSAQQAPDQLPMVMAATSVKPTKNSGTVFVCVWLAMPPTRPESAPPALTFRTAS